MSTSYIGGVGQIPTFIRNERGEVFVNPMKDYAIPFDLTVAPTGNPASNIIPVPAGTRRGAYPMPAAHDGPIEAFFLEIRSTVDDMTIFFEHGGKRKYLMNREIHIMTLQADAGRAGVLGETIFVPAVQAIFVTYRNLDLNTAAEIETVLSGIKYYPNSAPMDMKKEVFDYVKRRERTNCYWLTSDEDITLTANQTKVETFFTAPDDSDIEIFGLTCWTDQADVAGDIRGRIFDGQSDRAMSNSPIHISLLSGGQVATAMAGLRHDKGGIYKKRYATSWLVRRGTRFKIVWDSTVNASVRVYPTFWARKISYT